MSATRKYENIQITLPFHFAGAADVGIEVVLCYGQSSFVKFISIYLYDMNNQ
jgi:hypothetical protein